MSTKVSSHLPSPSAAGQLLPAPNSLEGPSPGSESLHPLPLGGLGVVWVGRAWLECVELVGGRGTVRSPFPAPTGGQSGLILKPA